MPDWHDELSTLVHERHKALVGYAYLLTGRTKDAEDLVQDALVKTYTRKSTPEAGGAEAYVRRAILNTWVDGGRRTSRWRKIAHLQAVPEAEESRSAETESRLDLHEEMQKLTPRERACIVLRYYEDLKVDDIASTLELSSGAVKRYLSDGLAKMAVALTDTTLADNVTDLRSARNGK